MRYRAVARASSIGWDCLRSNCPAAATSSESAVSPIRDSSAAVARNGTGPTEHTATRASLMVASLSTERRTATPTIATSIAPLRPTFRYESAVPSSTGSRLKPVTNSSGSRAIERRPTTKSASGTSRSPRSWLATRTLAPWTRSGGRRSAAGEALQTLPPIVPTAWVCHPPTREAECEIDG